MTPLQGPVDGMEITMSLITKSRVPSLLIQSPNFDLINLLKQIMSDKPKVRVGSHWKRPPTKVYDYNYDVGQHYYQPMIRHLDKKSAGVSSDSPGPMSFAERLAEDPLYGRSKPANYVSVY